MTNLTHLNLWGNSISDVSSLSGLTNLTQLDLWNNLILDTSPLYPLLPIANYSGPQITQYPPWDVNTDGSVNAADVESVMDALGQSAHNIQDQDLQDYRHDLTDNCRL